MTTGRGARVLVTTALRRLGLSGWAVGSLLGGADALGAQATTGPISGVVRDSLGRGLAGAAVALERDGAKAETGLDGRFTIARVAVADGEQVLLVRRLGYRPERRVVRAGDSGLVIQMSEVPRALAPVVVNGRENLRGNALAFYRRMDQGQGRFLTAEQIERRQAYTMRDMLSGVPGVRMASHRGRTHVRLRGSTVPPMVFLDGVRMAAGESDIELLDPRTFLGVEIYSGDATLPIEFNQGGLSGQRGGAILIWTREGQVVPRRPRRQDGQSAAAIIAGMIERGDVRTEDQVDTPARPDPNTPLAPHYPDSLFSAGVTGSVVAEFVIEADGRLLPETLEIVAATHPLFAEATRRALLATRFLPATLRGQRVPQAVQLPIRFTLAREQAEAK